MTQNQDVARREVQPLGTIIPYPDTAIPSPTLPDGVSNYTILFRRNRLAAPLPPTIFDNLSKIYDAIQGASSTPIPIEHIMVRTDSARAWFVGIPTTYASTLPLAIHVPDIDGPNTSLSLISVSLNPDTEKKKTNSKLEQKHRNR